MSIYYVVGTEPGEFLCSNQGWGDFGRWVDDLDVDEYNELIILREYGWSQDLAGLLADLEKAMSGDDAPYGTVAPTAQTLRDILASRGDATVIVISNGMKSDNEAGTKSSDDLETEVKSGPDDAFPRREGQEQIAEASPHWKADRESTPETVQPTTDDDSRLGEGAASGEGA